MRLLSIALLLVSCFAFAQEPPELAPVPDGAPIGSDEGDVMQPEVTIRRRPDDVIEEYRYNGKLYMIKIIPNIGYPYYLIDSDGDGNMETRYNDLASGLLIPGWVLFQW
jgi:hypothetical protein